MPGYKLDPDALEKAIKDLEDIRRRILDIATRSAHALIPGELTAGDPHTGKAIKAFRQRALGGQDSLRFELNEIAKYLSNKIEDYKQSLEEYRRSEDAATIDASRIQREA